jgi:hypothetical protein
MLVVTFGLYHGLVLLPVMLSMIGPKPYTNMQTFHAVQGTNSLCTVATSSNIFGATPNRIEGLSNVTLTKISPRKMTK